MKRNISMFLIFVMLFTLRFPLHTKAEGEGNIDNGGGGMGSGTSENYWNIGNEGIRVTIIRASDHLVVTTPVDFTNNQPANIQFHFGKVSKKSYSEGASLTPSQYTYTFKNPDRTMPEIISTSGGNVSIDEIKEYFCSEYMIMTISETTGFNYDTLINGDYKILLEPIAYITFQGVKMAMTATEAALYDQVLNGGLRSRMVSLSHKNLPLAMFLEVADLGYPAWSGSTTTAASNANIISSLGLGIVRFSEADPPGITTYDYEYRVNTEVITSVTVSGGQSDPDNPVAINFNINGTSYTVYNVYYPDSDSQLAWVRWTTPATPQTIVIAVNVSGTGGSSQEIITANIVDLSGNNPPDAVADDRNDSYTKPEVPNNAAMTTASWGVWSPRWYDYWVWISNWVWFANADGEVGWVDLGNWVDQGWWVFDWNSYTASLSATMSITPDDKVPTASGDTIKSGYGVNQTVTAKVNTTQSSAVTGAQTALTYFPEFQYQTYWRLLDQTKIGLNSAFEFPENEYSTYNRPTHFTPIWMPNGSYTLYTYLEDCWTPCGMLSTNLTDSVNISGNLWSDWHIAPVNP